VGKNGGRGGRFFDEHRRREKSAERYGKLMELEDEVDDVECC
jgi:hypothetical protein